MSNDDSQALMRIKRQLEQERSSAKAFIEILCETIDEDRWGRDIPREWQTAGFVQELTIAAAKTLDRGDANASASLSRFAIAIVTGIPPSDYPPPILAAAEGAAWKELANGHRYLGEYEASLRALDAADRTLESVFSLTYDRAVVGLARALVLCDMRRFDEAHALALDSSDAFKTYEDHRRTGQCLLVQGMIEQRRAMLTEACDLYSRAIDTFKKTDDLHSLASAYNNLAQARMDLGQMASAVGALHDAIAIFTDLGEMGELLRTKWVLGRLLLGSGRFQRARDVLLEARNAFRSMSMLEEAGLAGLELVEAFHALGSIERARAVTEEVLQDFQRAQLGDRMATALAYLRDFVDSPRGPDVVKHVKKYIEELREHPRQVFVPLPEDE